MKTLRLGVAALAAAVVLSGSAQAQVCVAPIADGSFQAHWTGDASASDALGRAPGVLVNGASAGAPGIVAGSFHFDGVDDYVEVPNVPELNPVQLSVAMWVRFDALDTPQIGANAPGLQYLAFKSNGASAKFEDIFLIKNRIAGTDVFLFGASNGPTQAAAIGTSPIVVGEWNHVVGTFDGATLQVYVNGVLEGQQAHSLPLVHTNWPLVLGRSAQDGGPGEIVFDAPFAGDMDDVQFYSRALSAAEIQAIYSAGPAGICDASSGGGSCIAAPAGMVAWWPMDGNPADVIAGHDGTTIGGATYSVDGIVGGSLQLDGLTGHTGVAHDPGLNPSGSFTLAAWIHPDALQTGHILAKWGDAGTWSDQRAYSLLMTTQRGLLFAISDDAHQRDGAFHTFEVDGVLWIGGWNHVVAVYDQNSGTRRLYVDGQEIGSRTDVPVSVTASIADVGIGAQLSAPGIALAPFPGAIDEVQIYDRALSPQEILAMYQAGSAGYCTAASISGTLSAPCSPGTLSGVGVDLFAASSDSLVASDVTDSVGHYAFADLPRGDYEIAVSTPLGLATDHQDSLVSVEGIDQVIDFSFSCLPTTAKARGKGYWKHQFKEARERAEEPGGHEHAEHHRDHEHEAALSDSVLCAYLDMIEVHFGNNQLNSVVVYSPPVNGVCTDKIHTARDVFKKYKHDRKRRKASAELFAVLLNIASGRLSQFAVATEDSATVSQAITYCDELIDDPAGDYELARKIAKKLNRNKMIDAGVVPLETANIAYKHGVASERNGLLGNAPNPFNPQTTIRFSLLESATYEVCVYNSAGRLVDRIVGRGQRGLNELRWDAGRGRASSGIYFYTIRTDGWTASGRMALIK